MGLHKAHNEPEAACQIRSSNANEDRLNLSEEKLDKMMDLMIGFGEQLLKLEEDMKVGQMSHVPSTHGSLSVDEGEGRQPPSFEELKTDTRMQAEIKRRLQMYEHRSRTE